MPGPARKRQKREEYRKAQSDQNGNGQIEMPKKKYFRQRAHANPFSDHALEYPTSPESMDWSKHFPAFIDPSTEADPVPRVRKQVEVADIGCGFGGLLVGLSPQFRDTLMIGMELRTQVTDYVISRVAALRSQNPLPEDYSLSSESSLVGLPPYHNISALRTNTMKFLPNYFSHHQLRSIFLCFPDPHFKARKHKARIVSAQLSAEYAYVLRPGGKVYTITDVEELHEWMVSHFVGSEAGDARELWERVDEEEERGQGASDSARMVKIMREETEEGKKVSRNGGMKYVAVFRRQQDPVWPG